MNYLSAESPHYQTAHHSVITRDLFMPQFRPTFGVFLLQMKERQMVEIKTDAARGGEASPTHRILKVLVASLVLLMGAWYVVETFF